jgi:hypothetical protein
MPIAKILLRSRPSVALIALAVLSACRDAVPPLPPTVAIQGDSAPLLIGGSRTFTADAPVAWSVNGIAGGSAEAGVIDAAGRYTAPLLLQSAEPMLISAVNAASGAADTIRLPLTPAPLEGDWYSYQPRAIRVDRTGPVVLTVHAPPGVTRIALTYKDGSSAEFAHRGGLLFQVAIPAAKALAGYVTGESRNHVGFIDHYEGDSRLRRVNAFVNVLDADVAAVPVEALAADAQSTDYVLNLRWTEHVTGVAGPAIARRLYELLPDDFDFIAMVWPINMTQNRYFSFVRNDTRGIGLAPMDAGLTFGSAARLQGTIQFPIDGMFDLGAPVASHEIGHRWINHLKHDALRPGGAHWPIGDIATGMMGFSIAGSGAGGSFNYRIDQIGPSEYQLSAQAPTYRFSMLELYLMGLATPEEVPPFYVFEDQNQGDQVRHGGILRGGVRHLTVDSLVAVDGPRVPAAAGSQRDFRMATVVVSLGRLLSDDEMAFFDRMARRGEADVPLRYRDGFMAGTGLPFTLATGGRARLTTRLRP